MTRHEAKRLGKPPGYSIRLATREGNVLWLADWDRKPDTHTTPFGDDARWIESSKEANSIARLLDTATGQKWVVVGNMETLTDAQLAQMAFDQAVADAFGEDDLEMQRTAFGYFPIRWDGRRP